jgi:hypothetical protein
MASREDALDGMADRPSEDRTMLLLLLTRLTHHYKIIIHHSFIILSVAQIWICCLLPLQSNRPWS